MKSIKTLSLLAVAAVATLAFAASASADYVSTSTGGAASTPEVHYVNEGGHIRFTNPVANIDCSSTMEGSILSHGAGQPASGHLNHLTFTGCTNSWHTTVWDSGSISIEWTSGHNGTITSNGMKFDTTRFGLTCVYETSNTHLGSITGGNPATLHIDNKIPLNDPESGALCGTGPTSMSGQYVTTSALYVGNS